MRRLALWVLGLALGASSARAQTVAGGDASTAGRSAVAVPHAAGSEDFQRELARGLVLLEVGRHAEALTSLRRASRMRPDRLDLRLRIAALEARTGEDGLAERHLRELLAKDPDQSDVLRELGALLIARSRPEEAEAFLTKAVGNRPRDAVAQLYLGLARHALEKDEPARIAFDAAAKADSSLRSQAFYRQGVSHVRAGEAKEARQRFLAAVEAKSDELHVARARRALEALDKRDASPGRSWDLTLTIGAAFDSNVSLLPDLSGGLPLPPGTTLIEGGGTLTTAAAGRLSTEIAFEARPIQGAHTFGVGGGLYQSKHLPESVLSAFAPPMFDQTAMGLYLYYSFAGRLGALPFRAEIAGGFVETLLDTFRDAQHFLQTPWIRPSFAVSFAKWASLRASYRYAYQNFVTGNLEGTSDDRDGNEHVLLLEGFLSAGRWVDFRVAGSVGLFGADGDQWDALFTGFSADARIRVLPGFDVFAGFEYLHRDFIHSLYAITSSDLSTTREVQRVDDRLAAFARLRMGSELFGVSVFYTLVHNVSSAAVLFGYTRHVAGLELTFTF